MLVLNLQQHNDDNINNADNNNECQTNLIFLH